MLRNLYEFGFLNKYKNSNGLCRCCLSICLLCRSKSEEIGDLAVENYEHTDRGDELVADIEEHLTPELASGCLTLFNYKVHLPDPAYCKGHDHCTDRHQDALGDNIVEVKPTVVPH